MTATTPIARVSSATARAATQAVQVVQQQGPGWLGGVAAGVQAALFSCALVLIPVWVFAAASADATLTWGRATGMAARVWLLGFGVPWAVDGAPISLIPLGIPVLTALMLSQLARRFASATWTAGFTTVVAFTSSVTALCALAWSGAPDQGERVLRAAIIALVMAVPSTAWGLIRQRGAVLAWLDRVPAAVRAGARLGVAMTALLAACAALTCAGAVFAHRHALAESATALGPDTVSGIALAFLETLYAPTLVVWVMAWLTGAGYSLAGLEHVPGMSADAGVPVPLLAGLPSGGGPMAWAPWLVVVMGAAAALMVRKRLGQGVQSLVGMGVGVAITATTVGLSAWAATGAMGPGRFEQVGPLIGPTVILVSAELGVGALIAGALWHATAALYGTTTIRVRPQPRPATATRPRTDQAPPGDSPPRSGSPAPG